MKIKEAIYLLDPATTGQAISEIEYYHGFSGRKAAIQAITEACELACEIMRKYEAEQRHADNDYNFCPNCGAKIDKED